MKLLADYNFCHISNKRANKFSNVNYILNRHIISVNGFYFNWEN
jgi:hypothetical protein